MMRVGVLVESISKSRFFKLKTLKFNVNIIQFSGSCEHLKWMSKLQRLSNSNLLVVDHAAQSKHLDRLSCSFYHNWQGLSD